MYTGELCVDLEALNDDEMDDFKWNDWISLYHHADVLLTTVLQNQMVDLDLDYRTAAGARMPWIFHNTVDWHKHNLSHTPYYQLFLDDTIFDAMEGDDEPIKVNELKEHARKWMDCPDLMFDVMVKMHQYRVDGLLAVNEGDRCR